MKAHQNFLKLRAESKLERGEATIGKDGYLVCDTCGSDCGQCGFTDIHGFPQELLDDKYKIKSKREKSLWLRIQEQIQKTILS